jgi:putative transposase
MSRKYKFHDQSQIYFVSFATVNFIDVFTRDVYRFIIIDSLKYCIENKDLELYAWIIMSNHVHLIIGTRGEPMENILRDLKKHTSKKIVAAIAENPEESRKEWMIWMFERAGKKNPNNTNIQLAGRRTEQHNQPIQLDTVTKIRQRLDYLHENPVTAGFVDKPEHWRFSSAIDYYTNNKGLIEIINLEL